MPTGLILTQDLFFASKVTGTGAALGLTVRSLGTLDALREELAAGDVGLVILDLEHRTAAPADVLAAIPADAAIATLAFGPHVQTERLAAAQSAGFQQVMPRSKFSASLAEILRTVLAAG